MNRLQYFEKKKKELKELRKLFDAQEPMLALSSGVNRLPPPSLYSRYFIKEIESRQMISDYTRRDGNPVLKEVISIYEKLISTDSMNFPGGFADNICITAGATAALMFYFEYYSQKYPGSAVLFLGLNYYAFYEYCNLFQLKKIILTSKKKNRVAPTIEEIIRVIREKRPKLISLTLPLNPSGEIYTENELCRLIPVLKKYDILFLIDKVQADVFAANFDYINVNKIIIEEQFVNNVIIIDGLSKTRSLPGARLGYIIANKEAIDYITYLNEIYYYNPPQIYIVPFIIDLMFRVIYFKRDYIGDSDIRFILRLFRRLTQSFSLFKEDKRLTEIFNPSTYNREYEEFSSEIENNYAAFMNNYQYLIDRLDKHICEKTKLQGGYNFCIKLYKTNSRSQLQFCLDIFERERIAMLPEFFYNDHRIDDRDLPFWIRITCAYPEEEFSRIVDKLYNCFNILLK